ncbi:MAG: hypothetical protein J6A21_09830 [Lentisphaeria bacterium]|nr:hypothetical protein [Lentisphaeria bacterium]
MSSDRWIYYDFSGEKVLEDRQNLVKEGSFFAFDVRFSCEEGGSFLLLVDCPRNQNEPFGLQEVSVNGRVYDMREDSLPYFIGPHGGREGIFLDLPAGESLLKIKGKTEAKEPEKHVRLSLVKDLFPPAEKVASYSVFYDLTPEEPEREKAKEEDSIPPGFLPGIGCRQVPGRFGFVKGDGVLDSTMFTLGTVCKMYMAGHPRYKKPFIWHYSTFPDGENSYRGSATPARTPITGDKVTINHLSSTWETDFSGTKFRCTYSLASPGIITESSGDVMTLSQLEYAGNYRYALLVRKGGKAQVCSLDNLSLEDMGENFLLLFSCTEFPDLPLLLVFQKKPGSVKVVYDEKTRRLSKIVFGSCPLLITSTPYGIESFDPIAPDDEDFIRKSLRICRFWSRAFLAYPVRCEEYYRHDEEKRRTQILQKFSFRYIEDDWGTVPLELAPLPPVSQLSGVMEADENEDFFFPSQFGPLKGKKNSSTSRYSLPWMPCERKFPLLDASDKTLLPALLKQGFDPYMDFVQAFPPPAQSYPYAGAFLEPYAFASALTNFLSEEDQAKLRNNLARALCFICDEEATGDYRVIDWSKLMRSSPEDGELIDYYADPALRHLALKLWNTRKEPFTGQEYTVCYLNAFYFSEGALKKATREEIRNLAVPLIENDWGLGLTFYYIFLAALGSGDVEPIRKCFPLLKSAFHFFEIFHDWACMGSGYSENGVTWCEGANYGAFTAFTQLCELLEEKESLSLARYYSSKQFALRMGIFRASYYYFHKYFGIPPYDICQSFREGNQIYGQFLCAPKDIKKDGYRPFTLYKMSTEGLYGELFEGARKFFPEDWKRVRALVGKDMHEQTECSPASWGILEQTAVYLMSLALDPNVPSEFFEKELFSLKEKGLLMGKWRGIHIFSRRLPENAWEVQLKAWNRMKEHPLWLTLWKGVSLLSAEWTGKEARLRVKRHDLPEGEFSFVRFGCRKAPLAILFNGKKAEGKFDGKSSSLEIKIPCDGILTCIYEEK